MVISSRRTCYSSYHLGKYHPAEYTEIYRLSKIGTKQDKSSRPSLRQETLGESFLKANVTPYMKGSTRMKQIVSATADFIVQSLQPISVVDESSFRALLITADPKINLPHRTHFSTKVIPDKYNSVRREVEDQLSIIKYCTITSDLWTASYQNRAYISLIVHFVDSDFSFKSFCLDTIEVAQDHSAQSLSGVLSTMFENWNIANKCLAQQQIMQLIFLMLLGFLKLSIFLVLLTLFSYL